ncbi:MAG: aminomethyl-transferring glycine dehydrogenase subunit GcvPA, partial [Desulfovibrio sp.]|nr:aminomethyl-transferring glycine dehydrogenase subunit GcvPA [Desulfovibrio sp.]
MPYIPHSQAELEEMLATVGVKTLDDLFADISPDMRPKSFNLPEGMDEGAACAFFEDLAARNRTAMASFLGAGYYDHNVPKAVDALAGQSAFYTAYTPYQAECSQGTLQAIFEFQTAIARLMDLDFANASVYDGGSALFEASTMCVRQTKRGRVVVDEAVNPVWRSMLATYTANQPIEIVTVPQKNGTSDVEALKAAVDGQTACVIVQNPNFFGVVSDFTGLFAHAKSQKALSVISVYPVMQAVLKTPGEMGADVAVGEGQSLGLPLSFGGPYLGLMACRKSFVRQMPGRLVGRTVDTQGRTGYVLTLQAREQ